MSSLASMTNFAMSVTIETDKFERELRQKLDNLPLGFDSRPVLKEFAKIANDIRGVLKGSVGKALEAGFAGADLSQLARRMQPISDAMASNLRRQLDLVSDLRGKALDDMLRREKQAQLDAEVREYQALDRRLKKEKKAVDDISARRLRAMGEVEKRAERSRGEWAESMAQSGKTAADSVLGAFEKLKGGDFGGVLSGIGKGAKDAGQHLKDRSLLGGAGSKALDKLGGLLSKIGPGIVAVGALAAALGGVVAAAFAADSHIKDLNKTLLDSGVAGVDLMNNFGMLGDSLNKIRSSFKDFSFNNMWGTTAKDHLEILGAYSQAGVSFKKMSAEISVAGTEMDRLKKYTESALTYSKLLGMSATDVASAQAEYMQDLGFSLEGVTSRFSNLTLAARESGFATKRFFSTLLQATSGMSMYNVRVEESVALLTHLSKILGEKAGGEMLGSLLGGGMGNTQSRVKRSLTTGTDYVNSIMGQDADRTASEFLRKLQELGATDGKAGTANSLLSALQGAGVSVVSPQQMAADFSQMDVGRLGELQATFEASGQDAMARMLSDLFGKSRSKLGSLGGAQAAMEHARGGSRLLLDLNEARAVLGDAIHTMNPEQMVRRMAAEGITGKSEEEMAKLKEVGIRFEGYQRLLEKGQADILSQATPQGRQASADKFNKQFAKTIGVVLGESGQRFKLRRDGAGNPLTDAVSYGGDSPLADTFEAILLSLGDDFNRNNEQQVNEDLMYAKEIADATDSMANILERGVAVVLEEIASGIQSIASFLGFGLDEEEKLARARAGEVLSQDVTEARKAVLAVTGDLSRAERDVKTLKGDEKTKKEEEIAELKKMLQQRTASYDTKRAILRGSQRIDDADLVSPFGDTKDAKTWLTAAAHTGEGREAVQRNMKALTGRDLFLESIARMGPYLGQLTGGAGDIGLSKRHALSQYSGAQMVSDVLGIQYGVPGVSTGWMSRQKDLPPLITSPGGGKGGQGWYDSLTDANDDLAEATNINEQRNLEDQTKEQKKIDDARSKAEEDNRMATALIQAGLAKTADSARMQAYFLRNGVTPAGDFDGMMRDPLTGEEISRREFLLQRSSSPEVAAALRGQRDKGNDFLMQVGGGQVKFAQRIDAADVVTATASKAGGALSHGGRNVMIVQHNYADTDAVRRTVAALKAAKAL